MGKRKTKHVPSCDLVCPTQAELRMKSMRTKRPSVKYLSDIYVDQRLKVTRQTSRHKKPYTQMVLKKRTSQRTRRTRDFVVTEPCLPKAFRRRERRNQGHNLVQKLDSNVFEHYLEYIWRNLSDEKSTSFAYLDCLWFSLYREKDTKDKVLTWIKSKRIFSRKYVFVPIVCWSHWSLLILCHFGETSDSKTGTPCMLLLDSLEMTNPKRLEPDIRKFVLDIYKEEGMREKKNFISKIPLLIPKVPQQKNSEDCGLFVLYFINLFLKSVPDNVSRFEDLSYFMNEEGLGENDLEKFCKEVRDFCRKIKEPTEQTGNMSFTECDSATVPIIVLGE